MTLCKSCGKDKKHHAKGLCKTCYDREFDRTRIRPKAICKVCGENKECVAHGMCRECYGRNHYKSYTRPQNKIICKMCKQVRDLGAHGMCSPCYKKWLRGTITDDGEKIVNTECSTYLGVDVAENVLSEVFNDVKTMPTGNPGYDFICNKGKKIDVKSACIRERSGHSWNFAIKHNTLADYFLCIAFDNRKNLNPLHIWLIPGGVINKNAGKTISKSTLHKWDKYKLDISKTIKCCNHMKTH